MRNVKKSLVLEHSEHREKLIKIPYKTYRILIILEPETQNGLRNDQKALGFPLKVDGVSRLREMSKKALVLEYFGASEKVDQNTL